MKLSRTKIAVAVIAIFASGPALAQNFSNLSIGTITNLTITQTGAATGNRISAGPGLSSATVEGHVDSAALGVSFTRPATDPSNASLAFVQEGNLKTLSLIQTRSSGGTDNAITGSLYTAGADAEVRVNQDGNSNVVDLAIGVSGTPLTLGLAGISIIQQGNSNQTELTRTAGLNTDTIKSYGNSNIVKVTGSATGTNSVDLAFGSDGGTASSSNQATVVQEGTGSNEFTARVTGSTNTLDILQSGTGTNWLRLASMTTGGNFLYARQTGSNNKATIDILGGDGNKLDLIQSGATTEATIRINGGNNNVDVTQAGGAQNATLVLNGSSNTVGITQTSAAAGAYAHITINNAGIASGATFGLTQQTAGASYTYLGTIVGGGSVSVTQ